MYSFCKKLFYIIIVYLIAFSSVQAQQNWTSIENETIELFQKYLSINTTNPPGDVSKAAEFLREILIKSGIEVEIIAPQPERGKVNVYARLKGSGTKRPLLMLHHMDVVPADTVSWTVDPFAGVKKDGYIYSRGALDMKNNGIVQLMTLKMLKENNIPLERDVILLAVADEEGGSFGTAWINRNRQDIDPEYVLDEGGFGTQGFFTTDDRLIFSVSVAEKRNCTMTLSVTGTSGHASMPPDTNASFVLSKALGKIADYKTPEIMTPITEEMKKRLGKLENTPYNNALMRNTISLTILKGFVGDKGKSNVIPGRATATLDCRLLPGQDPAEFAKKLEEIINDPRVKIGGVRRDIVNDVSPFDTDLFKIIERETKIVYPNSITIPHMAIYSTDSRTFRRRGAVCYGFFPGAVSMDEYRTIHGNDERIREESLRKAVRIYYNVIKAFCETKENR